MARVWDITLLCFWCFLHGRSEAFMVAPRLARGRETRMPRMNSYAASRSQRRRCLRMDDEIARQGIKEVGRAML